MSENRSKTFTFPTPGPEKLREPPPYDGEIVDVHTHLFPDRVFRAIRAWFSRAGWEIPYPYRTDEVVGMLRGWNVVENWALAYAHKEGMADGLNRWMGETQRETRGVRGFATVHPDDEDPAAVIRRAVDEYGLVGMKLHAEVQKLAVDDPRLDGAFDLLEERGVPSLLHTGDAPYPEAPANLRVERVAERLRRNPRLVAVIAHLGANQTERYLELMARYPGVCLDASFCRFPGSPDWLDPSILAPFADRVLFGSDFPNIPFTYADQVRSWLEVDWVRDDPAAFFSQNARRVLAR